MNSSNLFCKRTNLTNEASVENWFVDKLLSHLGFDADDQLLKTSIRELKVGRGSSSSLYKPDYIIIVKGFPILVIDAKAPSENLDNWVSQCSSYCLELNRLYEHNPVEFFLLTNGFVTKLYRWDREKPLSAMQFDEFAVNSPSFSKLKEFISKSSLNEISRQKRDEHLEAEFDLEPITLDKMFSIFSKLHDQIRAKDKKSPSAAFFELMKVVFVKIKKDRELRKKIGDAAKPKVKDMVFSVAWIESQTENENPINDPLFKNLMRDLEKEIREKHKRRIFDEDVEINLSSGTILQIVREFEHIDFYKMDEDIHGRMFESFLDATARGKDLGQFFTPRDVVQLMVRLADIKVGKHCTESVLDACCGSGGFLIVAMADMLKKAGKLAGLSSREMETLKKTITDESLTGIDAGSDPPIHRIARMNMYLHGDGGSNIYFADALDKRIGLVSKSDLELDDEIKHLRNLIVQTGKKFDVVLSNPPFSMQYSRDNREQREVLNQYSIGGQAAHTKSLPSSVMFLERYRELVSENGRILAIVDDSILSGESYDGIRNFIRDTFIIIGIVSLPGDAFKRADARVKTSVLILRPRKEGEEQGDAFMEKSVYLGLNPKTAKRVGITRKELELEKPRETDRIVSNFKKFLNGKGGNYVVNPHRIKGRLDVKRCLGEIGRRSQLWQSKGAKVAAMDTQLSEVTDREVVVEDGSEYTLLKVTYDGDVTEAERKYGEECSYRVLYRVKQWDILFSNMGVGRGAIGIVPSYLDGSFVSSEYTILHADSKEDVFYYSSILRTKEILGDILCSQTGMNRGRVAWADMQHIIVPLREDNDKGVHAAVKALESRWKAHTKFTNLSTINLNRLATNLKLEGDDSRLRWLAFKPPE